MLGTFLSSCIEVEVSKISRSATNSRTAAECSPMNSLTNSERQFVSKYHHRSKKESLPCSAAFLPSSSAILSCWSLGSCWKPILVSALSHLWAIVVAQLWIVQNPNLPSSAYSTQTSRTLNSLTSLYLGCLINKMRQPKCVKHTLMAAIQQIVDCMQLRVALVGNIGRPWGTPSTPQP